MLAQYAPAPLRLPFVAYLICVAAVAAPVALTRETIARPRPVREGVSLVPKLGVPRSVLPAFVAPAVSVFITMALVGFYAALSPTLIQQVMRVTNLASGATVSSVMFLVTAVAIVATRNLGDRQAMLGGLALMGPSVALLVAAQATRSMPLMLGGAAVTGVAAALGYRGSLQVVNRIAPPARRAEAVSTYYLCGFIGNALPVIGVGVITMTAGALTASAAFAALIALLAIAALVAGLKAPDRDQSLARST